MIAAAWPASGLAQALPPAPEGFDLSANIRLRVEAIGGQARADVLPDETSVQLRSIVLARYRSGPVTLAGELIDSRAFAVPARTAISTNEVNALEPVQAWISYDIGDPNAKGWHGRLTAGRMTLDLASRRLIARDDYRNTVTGFTGIRADIGAPGGWSGTFVYVLPVRRLPDDLAGIRANRVAFDEEGFDTRLWGGRVFQPHAIGRLGVDTAFFRFEERDSPGRSTRDRQLSNIDIRLIAPPAPGKIDIEAEAIRQTGTISASALSGAPTLPVHAWLVHGRVGYEWRGPWHPRLGIEGDFASGNRPGSGSYGRFDTLYGQRRADFSPAGLYNAISRSNLVVIGPRLELTPDKRTDLFVSVKKMWLDSARDGFATTGVADPTGLSGHDAGWQVDGRVRYWLAPKQVQLSVDGCFIGKGRFLQSAPNRVSSADTGFAAISATLFL